MIARAFVELFVGGLLEVKTEPGPGGERCYRASADIDLALLTPTQRLIVECLDVYRGLRELLQIVAQRDKSNGSAAQKNTFYLSPQDAQLLAEAGETINEALEYLPPVCTCSI